MRCAGGGPHVGSPICHDFLNWFYFVRTNQAIPFAYVDNFE